MNVKGLVMTAVVLIALTITSAAQQKRQTPAKPQPKPAAAAPSPAPTFDTLLPANSYAVYAEVRNVGQFISASAVNDLLEPVLKLAGPPKEFRSMVKWLNAHAEELMSSRLLLATGPSNKEAPETIVAVEFASPEEAARFAAPLNDFLPTVLPAPAPDPSPKIQGDSAKTEGPNTAPSPS